MLPRRLLGNVKDKVVESAFDPSAPQTITGAWDFTTAPTIANPTITGAAPATPVANRLYTDSFIKVWANVSVSGGVPSLDDDLNVSSITDNGVGNYTLNFATPLASTNYAVAGMSVEGSNSAPVGEPLSTTSFQFRVRDFFGNQNTDAAASVMVVGDQ